MNQENLRVPFRISILIAVLAAIASIGGLLIPDLYHDNSFVQTTWLGNDLVTLLVAVPILVAALVFARRGSLTATLIWMGMLDYMLYNYAFYLFGAAFNAFFLIYAALLGLSIFALIFGLARLDPSAIRSRFGKKTPVRWIGGYFLFVATGLSLVYVIQSLGYVFTGQLPSIVVVSEHPTSLVFALDLTLLIPWMALGAIWLIRRKDWGFVIAGMMSVKGPLYTFILAVNTVLVMRAGLGNGSELQLWVGLTALGLIAGLVFFGNMRREKPKTAG